MRRTIVAGRSFRFVAIIAVTASTLSAQTDSLPNWRSADSWSANGITVGAQVSSTRKIRLVSEIGSGRVVSPELDPASLRPWLSLAHPQIENSSTKELVLTDAVLIAPYPSASKFEAYSLTLQDTSGTWVATRAGPGLIDAFLRVLDNSIAALGVLSDAELADPGPLRRTDPERVFAPPLEFPHGNCDAPFVEGFNDVVADGHVLLGVVVDSTGRTDPKSTTVLQSPRRELTEAAYKNLKASKFRPATLEGHAVDATLTIPFDFKLDKRNTKVVVISSDQRAIAGGVQMHGSCVTR